jgi:hypothetical protein
MELIFLDRMDFKVLDYGYVGNEYRVVCDNVIPQKSTFTVNKINIQAKLGDLVFVKDKKVNYIGIIDELLESEEKQTTEVKTDDFISILNVEVKVEDYRGDVSLFLSNLILKTYIHNKDEKQNFKYLSIKRNNVGIVDKLTFEPDTLISIATLLKSFNKSYSIGLKYKMIYNRGKLSGIELHITKCNQGLILRSDYKGISNLIITDSCSQVTNKITFIPSSENEEHTEELCYYLLRDGTIGTDATSNLRYNVVKNETIIYYDEDFDTLYTTAQTALLKKSFDHSITFDYVMDSKVAIPFKDFFVGDFILFITEKKTYQTLVSKMELKKDLGKVAITLGEHRVSLTEQFILIKNNRR